MITQDFILTQNGRRTGHGPVAEALGTAGFNASLFRPYIGDDNRSYVDVRNQQGQWEAVRTDDLRADGVQLPSVTNATSLRKEQWVMLDQQVLKAARYRLRAWGDLAAANTYGGFNGMSKMVLEHEKQSDVLDAQQDMDVLSEDRDDDPKYQLEGLPLPLTHAGFRLGARRLAISRNGDTPLDTTKAEMAGRRVAELIEAQTIGTRNGVAYGGTGRYDSGASYSQAAQVYGYTNFPQRLTKTNVTTPTGLNPNATVNDVLAMRQTLYNNKFYGPFMLYHSNDWDTYLDNDYYAVISSGNVAPTKTLRERLRAIEGIQDVRRLDMMFSAQVSPALGPGAVVDNLRPFTMVLVQMTQDVARAVDGLSMTTIQWEEKGGMELRFKVMCIWVPQLRYDFYGNCGILVGTTS